MDENRRIDGEFVSTLSNFHLNKVLVIVIRIYFDFLRIGDILQ